MKYWAIAFFRLLLKIALFAICTLGLWVVLNALMKHFPVAYLTVLVITASFATVFGLGFVLYAFLAIEHDKVVDGLAHRDGKQGR